MDDLRSLAHDLSEAPVVVQREALAIVERGALNIKKQWADNARASSGRYAPAYPSSISYDLMSVGAAVAGVLSAEIGPDKARRQGALGNLLEFGSVNNPPHDDGGRALRQEGPGFEKALGEVTLKALGFR